MKKIFSNIHPLFWVISAAILFHLPVFVPFSWKYDELDYLTGVREIFNGAPLYTTYGDLKPPLLFWIYALACWIGGGIHILNIKWLGLAVFTGTTAVIYRIGTVLEGRALGLVAGLLFAGYSICARGEEMLATNSEMMMNIFVVTAYLLFLSHLTIKKNLLLLSLSALLLAAGFFTNQKAGISLPVFGLLLLFVPRQSPRDDWQQRLGEAGLVSVMFLAPLVVFILYYDHINQLGQIRYWLFEIPNAYLTSFSFDTRLDRLLPRSLIFFQGFFALALPILYGLYFLIRYRRSNPAWLAILLYLLFSYYAVFSGGKMMERYFIQILPPLMLIGALGTLELFRALAGREGGGAGVAVLLALIFCAAPIYYSVQHWTTDEPTLQEIAANPDLQRMQRYVQDHSRPDDTLFVLPRDRYYYYFLEKRIGTQFLSIADHLVGRRFHPTPSEVFRKGWSLLFKDLDERRPKWIIDITGNFDKQRRDPAHIRQAKEKLKRYVTTHYRMVGRFGKDRLYRRRPAFSS
ncbi:MAG: glycosyltransferase family 39 protein [Magnetococcales bacterium]|nr:glycosyltransferase family 39 protein [Magnetococcales bacterium]